VTNNRIALNTLSRIVREAERYNRPRVTFLVETCLKWLVCGKTKFVVCLSRTEYEILTLLGFSVNQVLAEARGKKGLCEVTIR